MSSFDLFDFQISQELLIAILIAGIFFYLFIIKRKKTHRPLVAPGIVVRPEISNASHTLTDADNLDLLGVTPIQRVVPLEAKLAKVGFPTSPVMPDLNVIDGVAPWNPSIAGNEWGAMISDAKGVLSGKTATSTQYEDLAPATSMPAKNVVPTPKFVPVPTMFPAPKVVTVAKKESFDEAVAAENPSYDVYNGYVNQPLNVSFKTPIDATMSKWTQFGACSPVSHTRERTRTCIHDGIDGGKTCGNTIEQITC